MELILAGGTKKQKKQRLSEHVLNVVSGYIHEIANTGKNKRSAAPEGSQTCAVIILTRHAAYDEGYNHLDNCYVHPKPASSSCL